MKFPHTESGLTVAVMFLTEVLLYLSWNADATAPTVKQRRRSKLGMTDCQPVPHHVLWQKLDLNPTALHKRLRVPSDDNLELPVADQPEVESVNRLEPGAILRRRRRSQSTAVDSASRSRTRRSDLVYRRLMRSVLEQEPSSNSSRTADRSRRRLRRLRRRLRRQPLSGPAVHQCRLEKVWKRMSPGVFPPYVETGRCAQTTCMLGLYECARRRYALTILRRVPRRCNPIPSVSANTTYEHVWRLAEYHVTVGCECARKRRPGRIDLTRPTTTSSSP